jgi:uncharacterized protein (DUF2141 family)
MTAGRIISILLIGALLIGLFSGSGCANIVPPGGGPRDSLPPVPVMAAPKDSATFVKAQKITITFDEFIELKSANEKVLISPFPDKQAQIEYKLKTITIRLKDSLLPNTTYTIDFGDAIVDLNEGNILKNFQYAFSTGAAIDSNELSGKIILAETGKTDSTMFAVLYNKQEDSTVAKQKPQYVARVDAQGNFRFNNLPPGTYYVYGLMDVDGNKQYNQTIEQFAFLDSGIVVSPSTAPVQLYAFAVEKEKPRASAAAAGNDKIRSLPVSPNLEAGALDLLDSFRLRYNKPLRSFDPSKVKLVMDSAQAVENVTYLNDSVRKQVIVIAAWKSGAKYKLFLDKDYATDTSGLAATKIDTISFRVKTEKEYGSVRVRFTGLDTASHPVLIVYSSNDEIVGRYPFNGKEFYRTLFKPGTYKLALLFDTNQNGVWDPGDYFAKPKRQPELVQPISNPLTIKENWDNELGIDLNAPVKKQ